VRASGARLLPSSPKRQGQLRPGASGSALERLLEVHTPHDEHL
jgi:hypothetical protein